MGITFLSTNFLKSRFFLYIYNSSYLIQFFELIYLKLYSKI